MRTLADVATYLGVSPFRACIILDLHPGTRSTDTLDTDTILHAVQLNTHTQGRRNAHVN